MTAFADLGPTTETDRLLLRVQRAEDFELFAELLGDEEACRYIGGTLTRAAAWRKFLQMPGAWAVQGFGMFAVIEKSSGDWLGNIGPWKPVGWPGNEVGWALRRAAWGKGYATEAAVAAIDWAFANLGWDDVIHCIDPANIGYRHNNLADSLAHSRQPVATALARRWSVSKTNAIVLYVQHQYIAHIRESDLRG